MFQFCFWGDVKEYIAVLFGTWLERSFVYRFKSVALTVH